MEQKFQIDVDKESILRSFKADATEDLNNVDKTVYSEAFKKSLTTSIIQEIKELNADLNLNEWEGIEGWNPENLQKT